MAAVVAFVAVGMAYSGCYSQGQKEQEIDRAAERLIERKRTGPTLEKVLEVMGEDVREVMTPLDRPD